MATEPKTIQMRIGADARFAAAVGGAARFLAEAAGLQEDAVALLQSSIVATCQEAFHHLTAAHPQLQVTFKSFPDRIEVALAHHGKISPLSVSMRLPDSASKSAAAEPSRPAWPEWTASSTKPTAEKP